MGFPYGSMRVPVPPTAAAALACVLRVLLELCNRLLASPIPFSSPSGAVVRPVSAAEMAKRRLPVVRYRDEDEEDEEEIVCSICLHCVRGGHLVKNLSNCRHVFHAGCLDQWVERLQVNCPNCRSLL